MTDASRTPWWYSGDEQPDSGDARETADGAAGEAPGTGMDWTSLLSGATRMVDWAASAVVEPHGEHGDPADHPECLVCRTLALVQDRTGMTGPRPDQPVPAERTRPADPIRWIPVLD